MMELVRVEQKVYLEGDLSTTIEELTTFLNAYGQYGDCYIERDYYPGSYFESESCYYQLVGFRPVTEEELAKQKRDRAIARAEARVRNLTALLKKLEDTVKALRALKIHTPDEIYAAYGVFIEDRTALLEKQKAKLGALKKGKK